LQDMSFDDMLRILENPTRRRILRMLARESHYPLQLSKELKISQQAVMKHLKILEDAGLVSCTYEKSDVGGPARKAYVPKKRISLVIDVGSSLYNAEMRGLPQRSPVKQFPEFSKLMDEISEMRGPRARLRAYFDLLAKIDAKLEELEDMRSAILGIKDGVLSRAFSEVENFFADYVERKILYRLLEDSSVTPDALSEELDLRERIVEQTLKKFKEENLIDGEFA